MTLEEAIKHCEEKACGNTECAAEHKQLAEWLKELQAMKSLPSNLDEAAREKAREIFDAHEKYNVGEEKNRILLGLLELEALAMMFYDKGAEWQKEQMMQEAISCKVFWHDGPLLDYTQEQQDNALERIGANVGDKVRLIIVKNDNHE